MSTNDWDHPFNSISLHNSHRIMRTNKTKKQSTFCWSTNYLRYLTNDVILDSQLCWLFPSVCQNNVWVVMMKFVRIAFFFWHCADMVLCEASRLNAVYNATNISFFFVLIEAHVGIVFVYLHANTLHTHTHHKQSSIITTFCYYTDSEWGAVVIAMQRL